MHSSYSNLKQVHQGIVALMPLPEDSSSTGGEGVAAAVAVAAAASNDKEDGEISSGEEAEVTTNDLAIPPPTQLQSQSCSSNGSNRQRKRRKKTPAAVSKTETLQAGQYSSSSSSSSVIFQRFPSSSSNSDTAAINPLSLASLLYTGAQHQPQQSSSSKQIKASKQPRSKKVNPSSSTSTSIPNSANTSSPEERAAYLKTIVCKFFKSGSCNSTQCAFAHDLKMEACLFWHLKGGCLKGDDCPYSHEPMTPAQKLALEIDQVKWERKTTRLKTRLEVYESTRPPLVNDAVEADNNEAFDRQHQQQQERIPLLPQEEVRLDHPTSVSSSSLPTTPATLSGDEMISSINTSLSSSSSNVNTPSYSENPPSLLPEFDTSKLSSLALQFSL